MRFILGLIFVSLTVSGCGGGGGGDSGDAVSLPVSAPAISSLSPSSAVAGAAALTVTINGSNFISASSVAWNGTTLATTFVGASQLTAVVPAADLATTGSANITVVNGAANGGTSAATMFSILDSSAPAVTSLAPSSALVGSGALTLRVNGNGFISSSAIAWNGAKLATTFVNATQLTAQLPASDFASPGTASVTVVNPQANGGTSATATFTISAAQGSGPQLAQWTTYQTTGSNTEVNSMLQFDAVTQAGSTIWVAVTVSDFAGDHSISVSDTQGNTFTLLEQENDTRPGAQTVAHFYASNIIGDAGTPDTITVTWGTDDYKGLLIAEISGATGLVGHSGNIQDGLGAGTDNVTSGAITVTAAQTPALLVALSMNTTGGTSTTGGSGFGGPAAGTGMTSVGTFWNYSDNLATFVTAPVTSAESVSATFNAPDSDSYVTVAAVFH